MARQKQKEAIKKVCEACGHILVSRSCPKCLDGKLCATCGGLVYRIQDYAFNGKTIRHTRWEDCIT